MAETVKESYELLPPKGDPKLGYKVFEILSEVLEYKESLSLPVKWNHFYALGRTKHWRQSKYKGVSLVAANLLSTHRKRTTNMLTDNNPTFSVARLGLDDQAQEGSEDGEIGYAEARPVLLRTCDFWWGDTDQQALLEETVHNGETYGVTGEKILWNPELANGLGDVETEVIDPFFIGLYPVKTKRLQKATAVLYYPCISLAEARRKWPDKASEIQSDSDALKSLNDQREQVLTKESGGVRGYLTTMGSAIKNLLTSSGDSGGSGKAQVMPVEIWVKDYSQDENGDALYPGNIRQVTVCNAGALVLEDRPNPSISPRLSVDLAIRTYLWSRFPFILECSERDPSNAWGISDFEQLEGLQKEVNKAISQFTLLKDRAARGKLLNPADSGVPNEAFTNSASIINPSTAILAQGIRWMEGPKDYADILQAIELYKELFFTVSGTFDVDMAQGPGRDVIAYKAIAALLERATTMMRGKIRNYGRLIRARGRMFLSLAQNFYTVKRYITYEEDGEELSQAIRNTDILYPIKLTVVPDSTMPVSKVQEREEALALFERQGIDNEELLKRLDWPDRKTVIRRMKEGPAGEFINKLGMIQVPPQILEYFQQIITMDPKDLERKMKQGEIPPFTMILQQLMAMMAGQPPQQDPAQQADAAVNMAKAEEHKAKAMLAVEQAMTEKVQQEVAKAGVAFDEEKLKMERAKLIASIQDQTEGRQIERARTVAGLQKDAEKTNIERAKTAADIKSRADQSKQGPYSERGLKSNNKKE